jgi:hypothetical protein
MILSSPPTRATPPSTTRLVPTAVQDTQQISDTCLQIRERNVAAREADAAVLVHDDT